MKENWIIASFLILLVFCSGNVAQVQQGQWVEATGIASVYATIDEAVEQARIKALSTALNQLCGTSVKGLATVTDGSFLNSIMMFENLGTLIEEKRVRSDSIWNETARADLPPAVVCQSWYRFRIVCNEHKFDPTFALDLGLNSVNFIERQDIIISVESSKLCYLYLFIMASNQDCYLLYPNSFHINNALAPNTRIEIPNQAEREGPLKLSLVLYLGTDSQGRQKSYTTETVVAVATMDQIPITGLGQDFSFNTDLSLRKMKVADFGKWLVKIPPERRTIALAGYSIVSRELQIR